MTMKGASWRGRRVNDGGESHALSERERVMRLSLFQRALRGGFLVPFSGQCTRLALGEEPAPLPRYVKETIREVSLSACHDSAESCRAFRRGERAPPPNGRRFGNDTTARPPLQIKKKKNQSPPEVQVEMNVQASRVSCTSYAEKQHVVVAVGPRRPRGGGASVVSAPAPPASRASTVPTSETSLGFDVGIIAKVRPYYPSRPALVPLHD